MNCQEIQLLEVIKDIAAGPFGSNLKVSCFVNEGFPIVDGANLKNSRLLIISLNLLQRKKHVLYIALSQSVEML